MQPARDPKPPPSRAVALERHGPMVWGLCRRLSHEPEDAYQDVWAKVFAGLPRFDVDGSASLRTWIATIAHRCLIDQHRRRKTRGVVLELPDLVSPEPGPREMLRRRRRAERVEDAIGLLGDRQRRIVVLHHFAGLTLEAIGEVEGLPLGTVKSRLHRARARLATLLEELE